MRLGPVSAAVCACLAAWAPAARAGFVPALPVDGPSADVLPGPDVALARDGSGALAYLKAEGGVAHVFFASLDRGVPQPPQRVDAGQSQASSQGRIAVASGGRAVVTWVNGGQLYAALRAPGATAFAPPVLVYGDPAVAVQDVPSSLAMTINGKAYAAFVTSGGDLRAAYMAVDGTWAVADQPLDLDQSRTAAAPAVAASGDGTALYAWTETGGDGVSHVVARRMIRTRLGTVPRELSVGSLEGRSGGSADSPSPGIEYDSSYAWIAFRQDFDDGGAVSSRVLARRLVGSELDPPVPVDGLSFPAGAGAERPRLAFTGRGRGTVAASLRGTPGIVGDLLKNDVFQPPVRLDAGPEAAAAFPVPTAADDSSGTVSWQRDPGPGGVPAIVGRHFTPLLADPEVMLSSPDFGPVDAGGGGGGGGGLEASADRAGNAAIAFTQGDATGRRVVVALYDLAPRAPSAHNDAAWHRQPFPRLHWSTVTDTWSAAVQYRVEIDHVAVSVQGGTTFRPAAALPDGDHVWRIVTTDARGQETVGADRPLRIDTVRPVVVLKAPARARKGARVAVTATASDAAPGSGVARVLVDFGDGSVASSLRTHRYLRAGRFTVRATVVDGAGNTAVAVARVKVK